MRLIADVCLAASVLSVILMLYGLYRPWLMLWWEDRQNRKKVLMVYGGSALLFFVLYELLSTIMF